MPCKFFVAYVVDTAKPKLDLIYIANGELAYANSSEINTYLMFKREMSREMKKRNNSGVF